jgi:hypothetical protein
LREFLEVKRVEELSANPQILYVPSPPLGIEAVADGQATQTFSMDMLDEGDATMIH